jgi:hypothetical protein
VKQSTLLLVNAFLFIAAGIAFALYGPLMINFFGVLELDEATSPMYWYVASFARLYGAGLFGFGFIIWAVRGLLDNQQVPIEIRQRALFALLLAHLISVYVAFIQQTTIWINPAGWIVVAVHLVFLLGYGFFMLRMARNGHSQYA